MEKNMAIKIDTNKELNWIVTLVMSIIFGYAGVDRFMMGHIGLGLLKLCTVGGFGIWYIVDIILIATRYPFKNVTWI
jgi:TM2 domain-containing membrane protein YozV